VSWKHPLFRLLGKDPEAVVVSFLSGPEDLARRMVDEVRSLVPDREHYAVVLAPIEIPGVRVVTLDEAGDVLRRKRIGLAPFLLNSNSRYQPVRRAALRMAPRKLLAYNDRLERHHLRLSTPVASALFARGVPLDRIWLRPRWLWPWRRDRTTLPSTYQIVDGCALTPGRARVAVLSPYFPYPLSHGGAVRIYNLLREAARDFDVFLFAFVEAPLHDELRPLLELCAKVITVPLPRYREPRWSTLKPPETGEFHAPMMARMLRDISAQYQIALRQVEYTQLARYGGDILVEHDVTFDLFEQVARRTPTLAARWDLWRWRRFERWALDRFRRVVVMSEKDAALLRIPHAVVIPNGVDLERFQPEPERDSGRVLFIGSFRHFPNVVAFEFFINEIWPRVIKEMPEARATVIAGPNYERYWSGQVPAGIELLGFIADVRPYYVQANVVAVPTTVSAGTNLKVLEAMAMQRAIVSTVSGCAGIALEDNRDAWIAGDADAFARGIVTLLADENLRHAFARNARHLVEQRYDWRAIGALQKKLWTDLISGAPLQLRPGSLQDLARIEEIQAVSHLGANWEPSTYLAYDLTVAQKRNVITGFIVTRNVAPDEIEILNVAVDPAFRRQGIATTLINSVDASDVFLEVRESNTAAIATYESLGFVEVGRRSDYYDDPVENAIVMRRSSGGIH
jgi:ribosomal protein S18 acetylase RimI-like enzyme/glycosyltransferase involved in cell wall biosynthesis